MSALKFAIDFDSLITNIYRVESGLVLSEPTVAAYHADKEEIKAIGLEASKLIGKTGKETKIVFPVFEGEVVNVKVASKILKEFLNKVGLNEKISGGNAVFSVPCGVTTEMISKLKTVAKNSGLKKVYFVESPILSAFGQRIPFSESVPTFVIDMAGGTTNVAALSMDGIIAGISVNFGASKISADIIDYLAENYGLQIGLQSAEKLRKEIGSLEEYDNLSTVVNGRDVKTGAPKAVSVKASDVYLPLKKYYEKIAEITQMLVRKLPPEVLAEIHRSGIFISGNASSVYGLADYFEQKLGIKTTVAENGLMSVALGGGIVISNNDILKKVCIDC